MTTRLSRELVDHRGSAGGITYAMLEEAFRAFNSSLWAEKQRASALIAADDLNDTVFQRMSIVLSNGVRFVVGGPNGPTCFLTRNGKYSHLYLTMSSCVTACSDPAWCAHPETMRPMLDDIVTTLVDAISTIRRRPAVSS